MNLLDLDSNPNDKHVCELRKILHLFQEKDFQAADKHIARRINLYPDDARTYIVQSFMAEAQKNTALAINACQAALTKDPNNTHYVLRIVALQKNTKRVEEAKNTLIKYLDKNPKQPDLLEVLADIQYTTNEEKPCFITLLHLAAIREPNPHQKNILFRLCSKYKINISNEKKKKAFINMLHYQRTDPGRLTGNIGEYIFQSFNLGKSEKSIDINQAENDQLFIASLPHIRFTNPSVELLITTLREALLRLTIHNGNASYHRLKLIEGIALNAFLTEYVFYTKPEEHEILNNIKKLISTQLHSDSDINKVELPMLLLAMYEPLNQPSIGMMADDFEAGNLPKSLTNIVRACITEKQIEADLLTAIKTPYKIKNNTSKSVQEHYEQNPYPRWTSAFQAPLTNLYDAIKNQVPSTTHVPKILKKEDLDILIAGSGTGHQPISLAMQLPKSRITAIDLSRVSLAYAMRKQQEMGCDNIRFHHCDLLAANQLGASYDYIECSGVLHHMEDPKAGWLAIRKLLNSGGVMKIGLYSRTARREISKERNIINRLKLQPTPDNIRNYRQNLINRNPESSIPSSVTDFYSLSDCRDLLFHQHEKCFDWLEIQEICKDLDLELLCLSGKGRIVEEFISELPHQKTQSFKDFDKFEKNNPDAFIGMYQFYVMSNH